MSALAWTALGSLAAWCWLLLGQGFFWRTDQRLPRRTDPAVWPAVAVVVPARDEAAVLPDSLPSLLGQRYLGRAEIVLVDDNSSDGTGEVARSLAARHGGLPLRVVTPGEPEPGWTGKLWALRHGIAVARANSPEFLLLTDADIAHEPDSLRDLVAAAHGSDEPGGPDASRDAAGAGETGGPARGGGPVGGYDLVSQMARLRVESGWERLVVPAFVYFFAQLYPFRWINRDGARTTAAAGGCVLLRTETAARANVPASIRHAVIDDVSLACAVRRAGGRIWLGLADRVDSVRPYPRLADLWQMVSRSAYAQLRHNALVLAATVAGLALVYLVPPVVLVAAAAAGDPVAAWAAGLAWAVMAGTYVPMLRYYRQPLLLAPTLPFTALLYLLMTVDSAVQHYRGRGAAWKGRTYARPEAAPDR
ncbi:glycosyltransferase [Streptomyces sp. NPDC015127]|uniref:glycosyltransferase n=1 Tax=Streptomyces sp. NPDC015127 TaxID=3364939 RepID=UPI0036F85545